MGFLQEEVYGIGVESLMKTDHLEKLRFSPLAHHLTVRFQIDLIEEGSNMNLLHSFYLLSLYFLTATKKNQIINDYCYFHAETVDTNLLQYESYG